VPAVVLPGALTAKWVASAAPTVMALLVPVMLLVTVSAAVMARLPAVRRVALKEPVPAVRVLSVGRVALPSLL